MTKSKSTDVVDWKERMASRVAEVKEDEQPGVVNMSLASGIMSIMDQPIPNNEIDVIIVGLGVERTFYDRPYDIDDKSPPDCYAQKLGNDDTFNPNMVPAENVPNPKADSCAECAFSKMGTADRGKGPACKTRRRLVCAPASVVGNPDSLGKQLMTINVPPTSGGNFSKYVNSLAANGVPPEAAVTKVKYGPSKKVMFEMNFEAVSPIEDDATLAAIFGAQGQYDTLLLGGYNYEDQEEGGSSKY